ncbi:unnamed protein product, partial [Candidula unifasciata]
FNQMRCLRLLKKTMDAILDDHLFTDISSYGSLLYCELCTVINLKITDGTQVQKAEHLFNKWTKWFTSVGSQILTPDQTPRARLSISFLRKV